MSETVSASHGHDDHPSFLQHHFETAEQQFTSGKLGMWLFLATEILLFAGLFCAYAVYRGLHPEIFIYAHFFLDTKLGAINTIVLLFSSFTMAWGVRAAQLGQRKLLMVLLSLTILCGFGFLGIKYVEYSHKIHDGLLWGRSYDPQVHGESHGDDHAGEAAAGGAHAESVPAAEHGADGAEPTASTVPAVPLESGAARPAGIPDSLKVEPSLIAVAPNGPAGTVLPAEEDHGQAEVSPENVHIFFGIYFLMTGLHGIHVVIGMLARPAA